MAGRKTKLTSKTQRAICDVMRSGGSYAAAAAHAGICESTLHDWRKYGAEQEAGIYRNFVDAEAAAIDEGEAVAARQVFKCFTVASIETVVETTADGAQKTKVITRPPDAGMALKWLERRAGARWNVARRVALGGDPDGVPFETVSAEAALAGLDKLTAAELAALAAIEDAMRTRAERPDEGQSAVAMVDGVAT